MPTTIESLELEVQSSSTSAVSSIEALSSTLSKLKNATKGGVGLTSVVNQLKGLNTALSGIDGSSAGKLDTLSNSLSKLSGLGNIKISSSIANQLKNIGGAATSLNGVDFSGIGRLSTALQSLTSLGKSNLTSFITQLGKLPQLAQTLQDMNMAQFTSHIQQLSNSLAPLASQLNMVASSFTRLPANIRNTVSATNTIARANNVAATSYVNLWAKCRMAMNVVRGIGMTIASWSTQSNRYIENLNLFTVSMGEYASEAKKYAEQVGEIMGIHPGEFMRNQGIFMTITKGFGVASDKANIMSKNLTQLGYDLTSFYNLEGGVADGMQKLQSGIAGELEPLRRLGYDLSVARLQQEAYTLGIKKNVSAMTQAEKAQIRYYTIMKQVSWVQGDMARTLNAPANQLRVLSAQVKQCATSLGNLFIPVLNAVLPYAIAFVKIIRMAADAIARLFNFELPKMDDSGINAGSSAVGDLADGLGDASSGLGSAAKEAKKLKNALLGIDELNVISPNDDSSGSGGSAGSGGMVGGGDLGFELPTYDFLKDAVNSRVQELIDKFKEWAGLTDDIDTWAEFFHTKLGRILTTVGAIALGLAAWKISKGVLSALQYLQTLKGLGLTKPLMISVGVSLAITGIALEAAGIIDAIQNELNGMNFTQIIGGGGLIAAGGALIGKSLGSAILGGGIGAVVAGIPAFITGIYLSLRDGIDWLTAALTAVGATAAGAGIGAIIGACGGPIGAGIGALIGLAVGLVTDGVILIVQNWDKITAFFKKFFTVTIPKLWNDFTGWLSRIPGELKKFFTSLPGKISQWFDKMWKPIKAYDWYGLGQDIGKWFGNAVKSAIDLVTVIIPNWFTKMWNSIKSAFTKFFTVTLPKFFTETIPSVVEKIGSFFKELPKKIYDAFISAKDWFVDIGSSIIDGIWEGLQSIWKAIKDFVSGFVDGFKEALGIHSPSTIFKAIGDDIVAGLLQGIKGFTNMMNTVKEWAGSVVEWFTKGKDGKGIVENFKETAGNIINGFKDKVGSTYTAVKTNISTWATSVKEWFSNSSFGGINRETFSTFANNTIEGFKTKISTTYTNVKSTITTWASSVKEWFTSSSFGGVNSSSFQTFANNTIEGFKSKISNAYTNTKSSITTWASNVKTWFTDNGYGGINNTNWQTFANNVIEGFKTKISSAYANTKSAITTWASNVKSWFSDIASNSAFAGFATNVIDGFESRIGNYYTTAKSAMTTFGSSIKNWFTDDVSYSKFYDVASDVVNGFKNGIGNLYTTCKNTISSWGASIIEWFKDKLGINSPSRVFGKLAAFTIEGYNDTIATMGKSTKGVMSSWVDSFTNISPKVALAVDTSAVESYDPSKVYGRALSAEVRGSYQMTADGFVEGMEEFYREYLEPTLNRMANDVKRQADKEEKTVVQVGNRTVTDAVTTQQKANGYRFST